MPSKDRCEVDMLNNGVMLLKKIGFHVCHTMIEIGAKRELLHGM